MKAFTGLLLLAILTACAHQAKKVDCDKHLTAINPPTPVMKAEPASKPPLP
jgi:hypothetical protein